jgi:hypothetical protein
MQLKGLQFDTTEVFETESEDFQDAMKQWQKRWELHIKAEGDGGQ